MIYLKFSLIFFLLLFSTVVFCKETNEQIVKKEIKQFMDKEKIPGIAVAIYDKDKGHLYNFGVENSQTTIPVKANTIFEIASITKVFTSTALAVEVVNGKMHLEDSVSKYLPHGSLLSNLPIAKVTLQDLATHTSSLPREPKSKTSSMTKDQVITYLKSWSPTYPIGTSYVYSNLGFGVIGYALEEQEKKTYFEVIRTSVLNPLGMNATFINVPAILQSDYAQGYSKEGRLAPHYVLNAWPAGGALKSTSSDMLKFLIANLGESGPKGLIKAMQLAQEGIFKVNNQLTIALGWQRFTADNELLIVDKNGGVPGFSSYIGMLPEKKIGIVILANKTNEDATEIGRQILKKLSNNQ